MLVIVFIIDEGSSVLNHGLSQFLPFLKPPGPGEQTNRPGTHVSYAIEDVSETNSKEIMKAKGQKETKPEKEKNILSP